MVRRRNIGDRINFAVYNRGAFFLTGRITCFYPDSRHVDVRTTKGHTYKVRV